MSQMLTIAYFHAYFWSFHSDVLGNFSGYVHHHHSSTILSNSWIPVLCKQELGDNLHIFLNFASSVCLYQGDSRAMPIFMWGLLICLIFHSIDQCRFVIFNSCHSGFQDPLYRQRNTGVLDPNTPSEIAVPHPLQVLVRIHPLLGSETWAARDYNL